MKVYVQFLTVGTNNEIVDAMGSSGVFILDGRNNLQTQIVDAMKQFNRLNNSVLNLGFVGFQIQKGNLKESHCVYRWLKDNHNAIINENNEWLSK